MSNIDKQALREEFKMMQECYSDPADRDRQVIYLAAEALLDDLEAKDKRNTELNEALKREVSGYKSCLRTGYERILELGGDCDSPEVMIAGNPDIQHAEKLIAAAAGKGEAS